MPRLTNIRVSDPVIESLMWGYRDPSLVGTELLPIAPVTKEAGRIPRFSREMFKSYHTFRAVRGGSNRLLPEGVSTIAYELEEHDIEIPIDYREEQDAAYDVREYSARVVASIMLRSLEQRIATLVTNAANYAAPNKITLAGTTQWTHASSTPVNDVMIGREAVRNAVGVYPNTMLLSANSFRALKTNAQIRDYVKYGGTQRVSTDVLAELFEVEKILIGTGVQSSDAGVMSDIWSDYSVLAYVAPQESGLDAIAAEPSFGYSIRKTGQPTSDTYVEKGGKVALVRGTDIVSPYMLGADAGYLFIDTNV